MPRPWWTRPPPSGVLSLLWAGHRAARPRRGGDPAARRHAAPTAGRTCSAARTRDRARSCSAWSLFVDASSAATADDRQVAQHLWTWVQRRVLQGASIGLLYDPLSALFLLLITGVGSLIHIYSIGYMEHDVRRARFFAYLNLFVAAMLTLVLADNYLVRVPGLGGRRPRVVPADRLLAAQDVGRGRREEGVRGEPRR